MHEMEELAYDIGYADGAAVAFGLLLMAEAIRRGDARRRALNDVYGYNGLPTPRCDGDD